MKIEVYVEGPAVAELVSRFVAEYHAATIRDVLADEERRNARRRLAAGEPNQGIGSTAFPCFADSATSAGPANVKPAAGRRYSMPQTGARRTRAEMSEDAEIDGLAASLGKSDADKTVMPAAQTLISWRVESAVVDEVVPSIRATPEDRQPPVETVEEADIIDEADSVDDMFAEDDVIPVENRTIEDVKIALTEYVEKFGMARCQKDAPGIMGYPKVSAIPADPAIYAKIVAALDAVIANG